MSAEPQRYEPELDFGDDDNNEPSIVNYTSPSGRFVLFSDWEALKKENHRLEAALREANANHEKFERLWYLRGDEIEELRSKLQEIDAMKDPHCTDE